MFPEGALIDYVFFGMPELYVMFGERIFWVIKDGGACENKSARREV